MFNQPTEPSSESEPLPRLPGLDRAATPVVGVGLGIAGVLLGLRPRLAPLPLALAAAAALFLRDPDRQTPRGTGMLFAPADGIVESFEEIYEHRFLHTDALRIAIRVSALDVQVQRAPMAGRIAYMQQLDAKEPIGWALRSEAPAYGSCLLIGLETATLPMLIAIGAGPLIRRVSAQVSIGMEVHAGARLATTRLGSHVDLIIPSEGLLGLPAVGSRVAAGMSMLGYAQMMP
ncbi:MAG: phosphatidylserine decarboxylase [Roseiflexaceae bacterium]